MDMPISALLAPGDTMTQRVAILAFDDCHASGVIGPLDLLHIANAVAARLTPGAAPPFATQVLTLDGAPVRAANGYRLSPDGALGDARAEIVIVPGIALIEPRDLQAALVRLEPVSHWRPPRARAGGRAA